jgi:UDP-glucose 4-epimerase
MKCLVTGGNGFIGSHVVDRLINNGHEVIVIDDLSGLNDKFYYNQKALYYSENICNYDFLLKACKNIDLIFHLAAESRIQPAIENPLLAVQTNMVGTANVLQAARLNGVKRVVYSSTSSVYGLNENLPTDETTPVDCLNPYSTTKYGGEELCRMYSKLYNLDTCIFRYFNVYGERSPTKGLYSPVIGLFIKQNKEENKLHIMGNGLQRRDFIHVADVADINIKAAFHESNVNGETFNIGFGENHSIQEIAKNINSNIEYHPPRVGEAKNTLADITKVKKFFDWKPQINLWTWLSNQLK